jgi:hypothetical protein
MIGGYNFNVENLDKWLQWLNTLEQKDINTAKSEILRSAGLRILEYVDDFTPVQSSFLKNSMSVGNKDNVFILKVGRTSYILVGTAVKYAAAVENGHQDRAGRFVPGFWSGDVFHYVPDYPGGMVLTGKLVPGAHMFERALDAVQDSGDLDKIAEFTFRKMYASLIGG